MSRRLSPEEERLWRSVTGQVSGAPIVRVRPLNAEEKRLWDAATGQSPAPRPAPASKRPAVTSAPAPPAPPSQPQPRSRVPGPPDPLEPNRHRRLARERDPIEARIDLHGMDQDRALAALESFVAWAQGQGYRAVLVITGKGLRGDGVLRQRTPEWLLGARLRPMVAGIARADRRHGGEGAFYVALKRKP
jgi:DNA-nicking Smr family endonuclease